MTTRVCVVGSVNMDLVLDVDTLPRPGETVLAKSAWSTPGGKGANQAVAAARAGAQVQFVGAVGDDPAAARLRAHLAENGVGDDGLISVPGSSGTAVVLVEATGENAIIVAPGANHHLELHAPQLRAIVANCDVLLVQLEIRVATAIAAAREARSGGATVLVNASPTGHDPNELAELAALTDVLVVNQTEAEHWLWPVEHRVVTRGAAGATYSTAGNDFAVPTPAVEAVDTSGAGDVFAGVLAANWPHHAGSPAERMRALRRACAASALATLVPGAGDCAPYAKAIDEAELPR
ncbi:PfkB family carbohydrate kinase [Mycobacterium botniense]|uniref:PfkB family carbohydrate kinase n=1 Tax=Mycobacterium botniense TaxID=84962 RepID=UPI002483CDDA|nr:PfkB family carbohydrate kinase [Mycobacterium botniense]